MYDYIRFLVQQEQYREDVRQAANDRFAMRARPARVSFSAFNSLAILGAILLSILIMVVSGNP